METNRKNIETLMSYNLKDYFRYYEKTIFGDNLDEKTDDTNTEPIEYILPNWFLRIIGHRGYFKFWSDEKINAELQNNQIALKRILIHELRHRFQATHSNCLISKKFVEKYRFYFQNDMLSLVYNKSEKHEDLWKQSCEFDANLIEWVYIQHQKKPKMSDDIIVSLITSNEKEILRVISRLTK